LDSWEQYAKKESIEVPDTSKDKAEAVVKDDEASAEDGRWVAGKIIGRAWKKVMKLEIIGGSRKKTMATTNKHTDDKNLNHTI
jgi:hypothetical protein